MFICPVCGFDRLTEEPYDIDGNPSYEICNCCGFEFGFDDLKIINFEYYREKWIEKGTPWFNVKLKPKNWSLKNQILNIKQ